jgi:hypothetical protein
MAITPPSATAPRVHTCLRLGCNTLDGLAMN